MIAVPEVGKQADDILADVNERFGATATELGTTPADLQSQLGAGGTGRFRTVAIAVPTQRSTRLSGGIAVLAPCQSGAASGLRRARSLAPSGFSGACRPFSLPPGSRQRRR